MRKLSLIAGTLALAAPAAAQEGDAAFDREFCATLAPIVEQVNGDIAAAGEPTVVDEITKLAGVELDCEGRAVRINHLVSVGQRDLDTGWEVRKQDQWNDIYCDGDIWEEAVTGGWQILDVIRFADKSQYIVAAICN